MYDAISITDCQEGLMPDLRNRLAAQLRLWEDGLRVARSKAARQDIQNEISRLCRALAALPQR